MSETPGAVKLSMGFAYIGHTYSHLFAPIFFTLVPLALERELGLSHGETVALIVVGNSLFGFAAPLAGWLADRWSAVGMMAVYFLGTGAAMIMTGLADTPFAMGFWLAVTGLFASIYHPVGIAWLVRIAMKIGTVIGINGVFGNLGPAIAAVMTGWFIHAYGWRAAYVVPGAVVAATGLVFVYFILRGVIVESKADRKPMPPPASRADTMRVYLILAVTMVCGGTIFHGTSPALPKAFSLDFVPDTSSTEGFMTVSYLVGFVYFVAGLMQIIGGRLADAFPARRVYLLTYMFQIPFLALAGMISGGGLVAVAIIMVSVNTASLPAENIIIARYTPPNRRAMIYGLKFWIAIGISSIGVFMEGLIFDATGGFFWVFTAMAGLATIGVTAILMLPADRTDLAAQPAE